VRPSDFFKVDPLEEFLSRGPVEPKFDIELIRQLRRGPAPERDDAEVAVALARLLHDELVTYATDGPQQLASDDDMREALLALRATAGRLGISDFKVPFRDFSGFCNYWRKKGIVGQGSWQGRRDLLAEIFEPLHDQLADLEQKAFEAELVEPISPHARTGWPAVDTEIGELRRHFSSARTTQGYRNVGHDCVAITEALSRTVYDPAKHLRSGETEPAIGKTKQRIGRFIEDAAPGPDNDTLRRLALCTIDYAQHVKHSETPTRREAGIAADAVIQLANFLRRLDEDK
jgi:hypothetical protein